MQCIALHSSVAMDIRTSIGLHIHPITPAHRPVTYWTIYGLTVVRIRSLPCSRRPSAFLRHRVWPWWRYYDILCVIAGAFCGARLTKVNSTRQRLYRSYYATCQSNALNINFFIVIFSSTLKPIAEAWMSVYGTRYLRILLQRTLLPLYRAMLAQSAVMRQ